MYWLSVYFTFIPELNPDLYTLLQGPQLYRYQLTPESSTIAMESSPSSYTPTAESIIGNTRYGQALTLKEASTCMKGKQPFVGVAPCLSSSINQKQHIQPFTTTRIFTNHQLTGPELSALHAFVENGRNMTAEEFLELQRSELARLDKDHDGFSARLISRKTYEALSGIEQYKPAVNTKLEWTDTSDEDSDGGVKLESEVQGSAWDRIAIAHERRNGPVPTLQKMKEMYLGDKPLSIISVTDNTEIGEEGTRICFKTLERNCNLGNTQSVAYDDLVSHVKLLPEDEPRPTLARMSYKVQDMDEAVAEGQRWLLANPYEYHQILTDPRCQARRRRRGLGE